jgi:hypothetical protein
MRQLLNVPGGGFDTVVPVVDSVELLVVHLAQPQECTGQVLASFPNVRRVLLMGFYLKAGDLSAAIDMIGASMSNVHTVSMYGDTLTLSAASVVQLLRRCRFLQDLGVNDVHVQGDELDAAVIEQFGHRLINVGIDLDRRADLAGAVAGVVPELKHGELYAHWLRTALSEDCLFPQ